MDLSIGLRLLVLDINHPFPYIAIAIVASSVKEHCSRCRCIWEYCVLLMLTVFSRMHNLLFVSGLQLLCSCKDPFELTLSELESLLVLG